MNIDLNELVKGFVYRDVKKLYLGFLYALEDLKSQVRQLEFDKSLDQERYKNKAELSEHQVQLKIDQSNKAHLTRIHELEIENAVVSKHNQVLEAAFENMGFDVKDMKDILNKLVDGIVSKNEIRVIK